MNRPGPNPRAEARAVPWLLAALAVGFIVSAAGAVRAADTPDSTPPGSCAERYPADGPAGLDLRLGCIAGEFVDNFTGTAPSRDPAPISTFLEPLIAIVGSLAAVILATMILRRRLGRRLAPVAPQTWWSCPACRSVNAIGTSRCYACGRSFEPSDDRLETQ